MYTIEPSSEMEEKLGARAYTILELEELMDLYSPHLQALRQESYGMFEKVKEDLSSSVENMCDEHLTELALYENEHQKFDKIYDIAHIRKNRNLRNKEARNYMLNKYFEAKTWCATFDDLRSFLLYGDKEGFLPDEIHHAKFMYESLYKQMINAELKKGNRDIVNSTPETIVVPEYFKTTTMQDTANKNRKKEEYRDALNIVHKYQEQHNEELINNQMADKTAYSNDLVYREKDSRDIYSNSGSYEQNISAADMADEAFNSTYHMKKGSIIQDEPNNRKK